MSAIRKLQEWYLSQCNGDWEHRYGITIGTLDNPGWSLTVDLNQTALEGVDFSGRSYGIGDKGEPIGEDWLTCSVEETQFAGYGGPKKLEEMINVFLSWANSNG